MEIVLYTTKVKDTKHNTTFDKVMCSYRQKKFEVILSEEAQKAVIRADVKYPMIITLDESQYFMKRKNFTRNDGTKGRKYQVVIMGFNSAKHTEFEKVTIDQVVDEIEADTATSPKEELDFSDEALG